MTNKEIILDTETTGLDIRDGHRIVEIGCLVIENFIPFTQSIQTNLRTWKFIF